MTPLRVAVLTMHISSSACYLIFEMFIIGKILCCNYNQFLYHLIVHRFLLFQSLYPSTKIYDANGNLLEQECKCHLLLLLCSLLKVRVKIQCAKGAACHGIVMLK